MAVSAARSRCQRRARLSFRAVNNVHQPDFQPGLQRHHLLALQLLSRRCFDRLLHAAAGSHIDFDDFRSNGLLLPANDDAAVRSGLPLHRGPRRVYNQLVIERVGAIEASWSASSPANPEAALVDALARLELLQRALRRRLVEQRGGRRLSLNRNDPLGRGTDFAELDAMAELLWAASPPEL